MRPIRSFRDAVRFYAETSGSLTDAWTYGLRLARAKRYAREAQWTATWETDDMPLSDVIDGDCCPRERYMRRESDGRYGCGAHDVEICVLRDASGNALASLCGIIDATTDYRYIVEAELCLEAMTNETEASAAMAL